MENHTSTLPPDGFVDANVFAAYLGISRSAFYKQVSAGEVAQPKKFGESARWSVAYM